MRDLEERALATKEAADLKRQAKEWMYNRIRQLAADGCTQREIAQRLNVSDGVVSRATGKVVRKRPGLKALTG